VAPRFPNGSRNTGDADPEVLRLAVVELQPDDDVWLCALSADLCDSDSTDPNR
jgi:hypothetical protein